MNRHNNGKTQNILSLKGEIYMAITHEKLLVKEEKLKEKVYKTFDEESLKASSNVRSQRETIDRSAFDDKEAFMVHGKLSEAQKKKHEIETRNSQLYERESDRALR